MTFTVPTASKKLIPTTNGSTRVIKIHAMVSSDIMLDLRNVFKNWEIFKFIGNQVLGKSFSLNPEWNKQKEEDLKI